MLYLFGCKCLRVQRNVGRMNLCFIQREEPTEDQISRYDAPTLVGVSMFLIYFYRTYGTGNYDLVFTLQQNHQH